jgi:hypothetical protein
LWGLENRELQPNAQVQVTANIATGFRAAITFPDLPDGRGNIFVQVDGGTDPYISRLENSASTTHDVILENLKDPVPIAGWSWTNATGSWNINQAQDWVRSAFNDFSAGTVGADLVVRITPSDLAAPTGGDNYPALSKQSVRYPFASFTASLSTDANRLLCDGTFAQTGPNQFRLVEYYGYFNHANPLGDLAEKFLSTPGSDAWAQEIVTQAQSDPQHWLMKAMELVAVKPPSGP